jgi:hypothetical protein
MKHKNIKGTKIVKQSNIKNKIKLGTIVTLLIVQILTFSLCQVSSFGQNENTGQNEITNSSSEENYEEDNSDNNVEDNNIDNGAKYNAEDGITDSYQKISQSDTLELYCNMQDGNFIIKNKKDNSIWKSFLYEKEIKSDRKPNKKWIETMSSLIVLHYTNFSTKNTIPSTDESVDIKCRKINDVLEIDMDFTRQKISLVLKIWIEEDVLHFEVPSSSIKEYGDIGIMQIDVLPFFMSACKGDKGYVFNPDGCGALYHFREENLPYTNRRYTFNVYSRPINQLGPERYEETDAEITSDLFTRMSNSDFYNVAMPVFGIKRNGSAILGIISEGEANSLINIEPYGYAVDANRVFPSIVYRSAYKDPRPEVAKMITYFEKKCTIYDSHIKYVFLHGENADYSGMANAYRKTLIDENGFKPNAGKYSGALSLFCGIEKDQVLFKSFIAATTFDQAVEILEKIEINDLIVNLRGSAKNGYGYFNKTYKPAKGLGGKRAFENMMNFTSKSGISVYIEENFIDILPEAKAPLGFNSIYVRDPNNMLISDKRYKQFIVNPQAAYNIFQSKYMKRIIDYKPDGITFARMGELIYRDSNKRRKTDLHTCVDTWQKFMDLSREKLGGCAVQGGNIYAAKKADWLYDVPMDASGCPINDEVIPFYQMVLHGLVDYSGTPGNLSYSFTHTSLKWVEYGCIPYFELTYSGTEEIMKTFYDKLYSSNFEIWEGTVTKSFDEFEKYRQDIQKANIVKHEKFGPNKVKVTYSNGIKIYVNYGEDEWKSDGITIPPENYIVFK